MALGALLKTADVPVPFAESGVMLSVFVLGALVVFAVKLSLKIGLPLIALLAICHGHAHATEMPAGASVAAYIAGFVIATSILQLIGLAIGSLLTSARKATWIRYCGDAVAAGAVLLRGIL